MTEQQLVIAELKLGAMLHILHEVQNDWFGPPKMEADALISWQEAFVLMLEDALDAAGKTELKLDISGLRALLSRAIGAFVFDDVEVPSLLWFTGSEEDVYVSAGEDPEIVLALVGMEYALWGDPLLEHLFTSPSPALLEGYETPLISYPRQQTKRLWYTLYSALVVLLDSVNEQGRKGWALEAMSQAAEKLKHAPCY